MSRIRLTLLFLLLSVLVARAHNDEAQVVDQLVQDVVDIGSKTTKWDWEASGYGGYILKHYKDLNLDGLQDVIIRATIFGEGSGWSVYYGRPEGGYAKEAAVNNLSQSILIAEGIANEDGSVSYFFDSRKGSYEAYLTEYQFIDKGAVTKTVMVDPATIYPNEDLPEWVKNELEENFQRYDLVNWSDFQKVSKLRASKGFPETLKVKAIHISDWFAGNIEWNELDLLKSSTANGYLRFEGDEGIIDRDFSSQKARDLLSKKRGQLRVRDGQEQFFDKSQNLSREKRSSLIQSDSKKSEPVKDLSHIFGIISAVLLVGVIAFFAFKKWAGTRQ